MNWKALPVPFLIWLQAKGYECGVLIVAAHLKDWVVRASWLQQEFGCFDCAQTGPSSLFPHRLWPSEPFVWYLLGLAPASIPVKFVLPVPGPNQHGLADTSNPETGLMGSEFHLDFSLLQCQDLLSQTSSPLSQNDSCTARSADLLLPPGDTGRRRHDSLHDTAAPSRAERFRIQVGQDVGVLQMGPLLPLGKTAS